MEQAKHLGHTNGRIFPYNSRSVGMAFRRACKKVDVKDLHLHDLRHESTSRLFEAGFAIEQIALVTGHKDWKMLRRYATELNSGELVRILEEFEVPPLSVHAIYPSREYLPPKTRVMKDFLVNKAKSAFHE